MNSPTPSTPTICPGSQLILPRLLAEVVSSLETHLALPPAVSIAVALQALSAALGPAARLADGAAAPLPAELNTLVLAPPGSTFPVARDGVFDPLNALQSELWDLAGEEPTLLLQPEQPNDPALARARRQPVALLSAPTFSEVQAALSRSFDGSLLAVLDTGAFERFWPDVQADCNGSRWRILQQLLAGQTKVPRQGVPRREVVSLFIEARPETRAARELLTRLPADLSTRFLVVDAGPRPASWPACATLPPAVAESWADLVRRVFARRGEPGPRRVTLSAEASRQFGEFHTELLRQEPPWSGAVEAVVHGWPRLARRLALVIHQADEDVDQPLSDTQAQTGIALARTFGAGLLELHAAAERELREANRLMDRQQVIARLKQLGVADFRTIYRKLPQQSAARWWPVLEGLVAEGLVLELSEGKFSLTEHQLHRLVTV